jgi:hypothetical protein
MARGGNKAPTYVVWVLCLILYLIAVLNFFGVIHVGGALASWAWIVGYALLLIAVRVRGL